MRTHLGWPIDPLELHSHKNHREERVSLQFSSMGASVQASLLVLAATVSGGC